MVNPAKVLLLIISSSLVAFGTYISANSFPKTKLTPQPSPVIASSSAVLQEKERSFKVLRVIDGDTIEVDYGGVPTKVRYVGINTPETVDPRRGVQCFGKEASNENKKLLEGKEVSLVKDISNTDKFGRLLRLVYLRLDNGELLFVNDYLIRAGFVQIDTIPPDVSYAAKFKEAENEAREGKKGLWANDSCNGKI